MDVQYSQDVVFDWGDLLLLLNEGTFKLIQQHVLSRPKCRDLGLV